MKTNFIIKSIILAIVTLGFQSCKKYLDAKPDDRIATVATLNDAQLLLDYYPAMSARYPGVLETQSDNYYLTSADYNVFNEYVRNYYRWNKESMSDGGDWGNAYGVVFRCNTVLNAFDKIMEGKGETAESNNVKGSALFFRSYLFYALVQLYAPIYDASSAGTDPGIPIRLDADFTVKSTRATVKESYDRIIKDLNIAKNLLPLTPQVKSRPSKPAVYGALARVYLSMRDYPRAGLYADSCLQLYSDLIDFNSISKTAAVPFTRFHKEVIFHMISPSNGLTAPSRAKIDKELYDSYDAKDLRKFIYFRANTGVNAGTYNFKANYDGQASLGTSGFTFGGIATDEMYLIRAESYARAGNTELALKDLNFLLKTRWEGQYNPITAVNATEALKIILRERRKELLYRGTRWTDLRRLSKEPEHAVSIKRTIDGNIYELVPGSDRYVLAIPFDVIRLSGMQQNP
ncbi:MAG TPA: RagB/SusD family nutrient uptake outer membrane protein [Pedobacter sp.]|uniref:RagB/SusD family nutrient uptake outer membrane protein n=1 Tax=Pedobacter sp. TaxID=1411316 RepID=UPI002BBB348D|nr:RagB/SusD family nutrient uptake outer membrane protein [Pedobacter sp.]HMI05854.1 RagB/SusD family nutrient uptake outer membrane protein [Pedobacter sp.]